MDFRGPLHMIPRVNTLRLILRWWTTLSLRWYWYVGWHAEYHISSPSTLEKIVSRARLQPYWYVKKHKSNMCHSTSMLHVAFLIRVIKRMIVAH
jgi:hypothetical protein